VKTAGIVGGMGPESTIEYYRSMVALYRERSGLGRYPSIVLNSIDLKRVLDGIAAQDLEGVTAYLVGAVEALARAGAGFGMLAANAPHMVFEDVRRLSPIPLLSIVEAACAAAKAGGLKRLGLFGIRFTMQGQFYADVFSREGIELAVPEPDEQEWIHDRYTSELLRGLVLPETQSGLLSIADRMRERHAIDGLLLAGTELSLVVRQSSHQGMPILDTTKIHVERAVDELLRG
jgi:aspartate racemase